jgi:hypothetical protein
MVEYAEACRLYWFVQDTKNLPRTLKKNPSTRHKDTSILGKYKNNNNPNPPAHPERKVQNSAAGGTTDPFSLARLEFPRFSSVNFSIFIKSSQY